jgi:hypothetical protein
MTRAVLNRGGPLLALLFCLAAVSLPGCQTQKKPTEEELQTKLSKAKTDPSVLAPECFRARYRISESAVENRLYGSVLNLNMIGVGVLAVGLAVCMLCSGTEKPEDALGTAVFSCFVVFFLLFGAGAALCWAGHFVINAVVGVLQPDGEVPFEFSAFCVLVFFDLTLIFTGISVAVAMARGCSLAESKSGEKSLQKWSYKTVLLAAGKALVVSIVSALASHVIGWVGGVIALAVLAGVAAVFNPSSE